MHTFHRFDAGAVSALALAALAPVSLAANGGEAELAPSIPAKSESEGLRFSTTEGLRLTAPDGMVDVKFGGRIFNDWAWHSADDTLEAAAGPFVDGTEFRAARFYMAGTIYENVELKAQYDFAGGDADFKDVYMGLKDVGGLGGLRVGHFKEPFSLEELTSARFLTFLERGLPNSFAPGRNTGAMLHGSCSEDSFTYALGVFRTSNDYGDDKAGADGEYSVTARATWVPMINEEEDELVHLGLAYSLRGADGGSTSFSSRPENHLAPSIVATGGIAGDGDDRAGIEAAWVRGPLSVQGEYMMSSVDGAAGDADFSGYYAFVSYFLTGEHRSYKRSSGTFQRVEPKGNYGPEGNGAWELAARYSSLDLTDGGVTGGELDDITLGVNWYLNPNARVMLDYVMSDWDGGAADGDADALLMRFQVDF